MREHHRYVLAQHLLRSDFLDEQIADPEQQITRLITHEPPTDVPPAAGREA